MNVQPRIVIVGGGIAGLAIALAIREQTPSAAVVVLESRDRVGGNLRTERIDGYLCEAGPDGFLDNAPETLAFVDRIGLAPSLLASRDSAQRRFIFRGGRLHEVPLSPIAFAASPLLSLRGKLRLACEPFARHAPAYDESILRFAERHIGREAAQVLVGSMVSGIFAGDAAELSLRSCFPKMYTMEAQYGSLIRAMIAKRREQTHGNGIGAPTGRLTSFVDGMESLVRTAAASLGDAVRVNRKVCGLRPRRQTGPRPVGARAFTVVSEGQLLEADAVVLAGPACETADLVRPFDAEAARLLNGIVPAPLAVVCVGFDEQAIVSERGPLDGFGFLVPRGEGPRILGALWESSIYSGRAPAGKVLLRVMIGGATDREAVSLDDSELISIVRDDLRRTMGVSAIPEFTHVFRHRRGIAQYTMGHASRLARVEARLREYPGLLLAGNSYRGVSINNCVENAGGVARQVALHLQHMPNSVEYATAR
jgi:oxygen-dependent protoporphyrinogen oxidase